MNFTFNMDVLAQATDRKKYNIGIIGAGFIVQECHIPAYLKAGFPVSGIASRSLESARRVAERFQLPKAYHSVDELLSDPEVEVVDIAVPPHEQLEVIRKVAKAGKHILAQKPIAMNLSQARQIVRICQEAGVKLIVNQNGRFDPAIQAAKSLLDQGYIGKPVMATIELRFQPHWQPYQLDYDRLMFLFMSIHHLDQFRFLFGMPERLYASSIPHPEGKFKGEYITSYILNYANGMMANAWDDGFTWDTQGFGVFYKIEGTEGVVKMNIGWPNGGPSTLSFYSKKAGNVWCTPDLPGSWFPDAFHHTMGELYETIETGLESSLSGKNNLETMALVEACYMSDREKRSVTIEEVLQLNG
jgi:predicted dehydrogenase